MTSASISSVVGWWRLVATSAVDANGLPTRAPYGPDPRGFVEFFGDGRMMAVLTDGRRELPPDETLREYNSYSGLYRLEGDRLITMVDGSSNPHWIGGEQVRRVQFDGEKLVLEPPPREWQGVLQHRRLVWQRMATATD